MKRTRTTSSNSNKVIKYAAREVAIPELGPFGMSCPYTGIPRYMLLAIRYFQHTPIVPAFLIYNMDTNQYGITKSIEAITRSMTTPMYSSRIQATDRPHFIMVGVHDETGGHIASVLVDPPTRRMWVFDPHGSMATTSLYGPAISNKAIPILTSMWNIPRRNIQVYTGPNIQARNGICSTFYIDFMYMVGELLSGMRNVNDIARRASLVTANERMQFIRAPPAQNRMVARNVRRRGGARI